MEEQMPKQDIRYVGSADKPKVTMSLGDGKGNVTLLWGDQARVIESGNGRLKVSARGCEGWVDEADAGAESLLEVYVIDVGQGDSVLFKTPAGAWHLIDGGIQLEEQISGKGAANFLCWKFLEELGKDKVSLDSVILTHPDRDHFGGLINVLKGSLVNDGKFSSFPVEVGKFYHSGLPNRADPMEKWKRVKGKVGPFPHGNHGVSTAGSFVTDLLSDIESFRNPPWPLNSGEGFDEFARQVGKVCGSAQRLSADDKFLPGYKSGSLKVRVLGPIVETFDGQQGIRVLESDEGKTRNGHSVTLRLDYKDARILLTGDLNEKAHQLLLSYCAASEFAADVAKACHHGSHDIELDFVKAVKARATVISSGDNEQFAHPRPVAMGASARYGREALAANGKTLPPMVYSTELARSFRFEYAKVGMHLTQVTVIQV
jgi:beta-lactamase superfamily II metal-dependent hydrolase